ncbi:MAG: hypothetical protein N7Q72_05530, partial [Spiroplasma sp. Tabriz.8]|nr:hypothetical protein [Spiroplasma sp. Tabriz.8]
SIVGATSSARLALLIATCYQSVDYRRARLCVFSLSLSLSLSLLTPIALDRACCCCCCFCPPNQIGSAGRLCDYWG